MEAVRRVAWNLRRLRVARGVAQEALADFAGVDRTYVSRLERAKENPTIAVLDKLARALEVDVIELLAVPVEGESAPELLRSGRKPAGR